MDESGVAGSVARDDDRGLPGRSTRLLLPLVGLVLAFASACGPTGWYRIVKIAVVAPHTGYDSETAGRVHQAVRMAVDEWNAHGGVLGRPIELVSLDDGNDAAMASQLSRELAVDQDVLVVIGHLETMTATASARVYIASGLPAILLAPIPADELALSRGVVALAPTPDQLITEMLRIEAGERSVKRVGIVSSARDEWRHAATAAVSSTGIPMTFVDIDSSMVAGAGRITDDEEILLIGGGWRSVVDALRIWEGHGATIRMACGVECDSPDMTRLNPAVTIVYPSLGGRDRGEGRPLSEERLLSSGRAALAYDATNHALRSVEASFRKGNGSRASVAVEIGETQSDGLIGPVGFTPAGYAPVPVEFFRIDTNRYPGDSLGPPATIQSPVTPTR